jgi:hypothetical protein
MIAYLGLGDRLNFSSQLVAFFDNELPHLIHCGFVMGWGFNFNKLTE